MSTSIISAYSIPGPGVPKLLKGRCGFKEAILRWSEPMITMIYCIARNREKCVDDHSRHTEYDQWQYVITDLDSVYRGIHAAAA